MNNDELQQIFDNFCNLNKIEMTMYSYFYFVVEDLKNTNKTCSIIRIDDAIIPFYKHKNEYKFPYLPLVNFKIEDNVDKYIEILDKYITFIKKKNGSKITFVPMILSNIPKIKNSFKFIKNDVSFYYKTSDFLNLEGNNKFTIRRHYNRYYKYFGDKTQIVELKNEHIEEVKLLINEWKEDAKERQFRLYDTTANKNWLNLALDTTYKQHNFVALYDNKVIAVMGFNEPYSNATRFDNFILKSKSREFRSLDRFMYIECLRELNKYGIEYMNCAGSLGIKSLYEFKNELNPCEIIQNFSILVK